MAGQKRCEGNFLRSREQAFLEAAYHRLCSTYECGSIMRIVFVCSDVSFTSKDNLQVSHSNAGEGTDGEWSFYMQEIPLDKVKLTKVKRSLKHILRTTEGASLVRQLKRFEKYILTGSNLLHFEEKSSVVSTPSVFEKDKLVDRLLSSEELWYLLGKLLIASTFPWSLMLGYQWRNNF